MDMFKAMADPTRRRILQLLSEKNLSAGEIAEEFTMSKPAISKHLDILKTSEANHLKNRTVYGNLCNQHICCGTDVLPLSGCV